MKLLGDINPIKFSTVNHSLAIQLIGFFLLLLLLIIAPQAIICNFSYILLAQLDPLGEGGGILLLSCLMGENDN